MARLKLPLFLIFLSLSLPGTGPLALGAVVTSGAPTEPKCRLAIEETILPEFVCSDTEDKCYTQAVAVMKAQADQLNAKLRGCPQPSAEVYLNEYDFVSHKSDYIFLYLPGLFTTAAQFWSFKDTVGDNNAVRMTLPGHGATAADGWRLTPDHWKLAVARALNMAQYLGKKIVIDGQSTGGFLAFWAALETKVPIAGIAVFEPALKVRDYYGATLCYLPNFNLTQFSMADYFERDLNLGCVIRRFSEQFEPELEKPENLAILAKIPTYVFVNPNDMVVKSQVTLDFTRNLIKAGGQVSLETYVNGFEGPHMHGRVTYMPLRPRFGESMATGAGFPQIIRGRNSYAEYLARNFNLCDASEDPRYLSSFDTNYQGLYPNENASDSRLDEVVQELKTVTTLQSLSPRSQETMNAYRILYEQSSGFRSRLSFTSDGKTMTMQEKNWKELQLLCCNLFESSHKGYTTSFSGPQNQSLNDQIMQYRFYITQAAQDKIDPSIAQKLIGLLTGRGVDLIIRVVTSDFANAHAAFGGKHKCTAWTDVTSMALSTSFLQSQITDFEAKHQ